MPPAIPAGATAASAGTRRRVGWPVRRSFRAWRGSSVAEVSAGGKRPPRLSAVIACYKDARAIPLMHRRLSDVFASLAVDYEIIFVNDGSPDETDSILEELTTR